MWRIRLRRTEFSLDETMITGGADPQEYAEKSERNAVLYSCLNRIAPQYREALWLVYGYGMSYAQAAQVMGCNLIRTENLLKNGKIRLRQELEKEGVTHADI
jgi:RNA polymerase sigma-70 factor (ECF subfamily)